MDYEYLILNNADEDNIADECATCPYKGELCNSQCNGRQYSIIVYYRNCVLRFVNWILKTVWRF